MSAPKIIRVSDAEPVDGQPYQTAVLQNPDGTPFGGGEASQGPKGDKCDTGATGPQGPKGDMGTPGATGAKGADGKSLKALAFTKGGDGAITGGTATLTDNSTIAVTVS